MRIADAAPLASPSPETARENMIGYINELHSPIIIRATPPKSDGDKIATESNIIAIQAPDNSVFIAEIRWATMLYPKRPSREPAQYKLINVAATGALNPPMLGSER